jgi:hypothetical protein
MIMNETNIPKTATVNPPAAQNGAPQCPSNAPVAGTAATAQATQPVLAKSSRRQMRKQH